ncbi:ABC-type branched-chain amino acid transport system, substrate-binding protein [Amycolatopsis marina]|uniref:ABC-type branched-chain amino acid transport system, substrate-binding protein n=1 Tax=Amycolatopsis marina TaxID=490629 RepID=A0A1I1AZE7_9PSEU|nr:ABC transporter substrate-binding protein [Amycolatopsis marina]SFB43475.1 ABC-type branched-chain amino acid transport system, substrate-binding protein [Amycolatopsis marina]
MTDGMRGIVPPETWTVRRRRRRRRLVVLGAVLVLIGSGIWGGVTLLSVCGSFGSGVTELDGECVGVTDGSYVFHSDLADVQGKLEEENARVRREAPAYVTVALLDPLTPSDDSGLPIAQVRNRLEGAYTALRRVNTEPVSGDPNPQIELVLANSGTSDEHSRRVVEQLVDLRDQENPLVAVIGLGVSTERTKWQAEQLSANDIPMVGAYLTADDLEYEHIPGLIKTSPSNRHYVEALRRHADAAGIDSTIMVRDANSDSGADLYTRSLEEEFERQMAEIMEFPTQQFTGSTGGAGGDVNLFGNVRANICASAAQRLQAVLFAGREVDLGAFIESLEFRTCADTPLVILTAGLELGALLKGQEDQLAEAKITVLSASTVDAEGWRANPAAEGTPEHYGDFRRAFQLAQFAEEHLDDGGAIMMHDALLTAAQAVRIAAPLGSASAPTADDVRAQLLNINTLYSVQGASGELSFSKQATGAGTPLGKPVPVLAYPRAPGSPSRQTGELYHVTG